MLAPEDRFWAPSGSIYPGGPSTWHIIDWDQRRMISVTMDEELESEDPAFEHLGKLVDDIAPNVYEIHVSPQGELISTSTDESLDMTRCVYYPRINEVKRPEHVETVSRSNLEELDRLGPMVDLVVCLQPKESTKLVFKYYTTFQRIPFTWHEMNLWMRLPKHPNIVPFDRMVVDELEGRVLGFTTVWIPGGTLEENKSRFFKLKWLSQLINVVDELNLKLGIAHQDIAPRNLVINETTDSLMLFDFNFSARVGMPSYSVDRNDIKGVIFTMYEIVTRDKSLRFKPHKDQDLVAIEQQDWTKHPEVKLDCPVSEFRDILRQWREKRQSGIQITQYSEAPNYIDWPAIPEPPPTELVTYFTDGPKTEMKIRYDWSRNELRERGRTILDWERPAQRKLKPGDRVLATGEFFCHTGAADGI